MASALKIIRDAMITIGAKPKLRGDARRDVMQLYFKGALTWREAAAAIGVSPRTISRCTPAGFDWDAARGLWVERQLLRLRQLELLDRIP